MDDLDHKILKILQQDGRIRMGDLAEQVGLSATPCARRVARMEEAGIITGYGARVDQRKIGQAVTVFVTLELDRQSVEAVSDFTKRIATFEEIVECQLMTGSPDILMKVVVPDLEAFDHFLETRLMTVPNVRNMRSSFTLRTLSRRAALPMRRVV
ncbi:Leucine-responsive regulatory protein [Pelagimonas phthalicica]|uniref:Leucine-responsive regulatory protein n=1 Tax=Pelagimonas phthalicica TaxID=1037362 RepID=A0A238JE19_9RHOB|nr:Lrp/AsnC family transcriptional regulator [Pelagimonas phthalicica]TDS91881.1 AsnC family transcriptional regulator [Pelagimonas phthalicica]SMX28931.1 Leucine-responsive regulatory protein [Pelagimonas phthalicica]